VIDAAVADGWTAVGLDVDASAIAASREACAASGDRIHFIEVDVTAADAVDAAIERIETEVGPITGLVNSAGIGRDVPFLETSVDTLRQIIDVNLIGSFNMGQKVAARMVTRGAGSIVNIASVSGIMGNAGRVAYGASKGAVINMTKVMSVEMAKYGVRVNAVAPGPVETAMVKEMHSPAVRQSWIDTLPQRRYGEAWEIAQSVLFLLEHHKSSYITGQTLCVDGGFTTSGLQ
jgi:NAD(P)-dependent dehydrogenase (short-subunit alcohol dehydrogenase family)